MKRKILWLGLSFLLVAALVLAACGGPAVPGEEEEGAVGGPQHGGTLMVFSDYLDADPPSPDIQDGYFDQLFFLAPIQERPLIGDFLKYGPRGTGEFMFQLRGYTPEEYMKGNLLESYEVSPEKLVFHVRPGIYWQGLCMGKRIMEDRELTAADIVADLLYFREAPGGKTFKGMSGDITATDKYTLEIEYGAGGYNCTMVYLIGWEDRSIQSPPEVVEAGADKWENQVGTGPFMLKEYVLGSHFTYERNPNYWDTATIDGKEYEIPFVDKMIFPILPDESTRIALLRTGKIDWIERVHPMQWPSLAETAPHLESARIPGAGGSLINFQCKQPPFDDVDLRRALTVGTDRKAFRDILGAPEVELPLDWWPMLPQAKAVYTPLDELPAETRLLYDYDPELAMEMLAKAGYPEGLKMTMTCTATPQYEDLASLLKDQWAKIGVEVEINPVDGATYAELRYNSTYGDAILGGTTQTANPITLITRTMNFGGVTNYSSYNNETVNELAAVVASSLDLDERNRAIKEAGVIGLNDCFILPLQPSLDGHFWQPWLKNYYGERNLSDNISFEPILAQAWIDQVLKTELGY